MAFTQITTGGCSDQAKKRRLTLFDLARPGRGSPRGLYIHVPFCFHKCHYCDFYSIVDQHDRQAAFVDRLIDELGALLPRPTQPLETIFIGGGTPTLLRPALWERLLVAMRETIPRADDLECTVEANPETVTEELAVILARGGVNRVSIGCQSFHPAHLKTLERWHEPESVERAIAHFRGSGIDNINLDLIFAIPGQTQENWRDDLERALALRPTHLSCYNLTYEPNTALTQRMRMGQVTPVESEVEAAMFQTAREVLGAAGFEHYEISNFAIPGGQCRHNLLYWENADWLAAGPSASGHLDGLRWKNEPALQRYLDEGGDGGFLPEVVDVEELDAAGRVGEALMMGLRLLRGLPRERIERLLEDDPRRAERTAAIESRLECGDLEWREDYLRLPKRGLMFADDVIASLLV